MPGVLPLLAAATTTTEDVPRIVGDPLSWWVFIGAGVACLVLILLAGWWVRSRASRAADPR